MEQRRLMEEAVKLFDEYKLHNWQFLLKEHTGDRLAQCDYLNLSIALNKFYALHNKPEFVLDSLKHEIAHALTPGHKHDKVWLSMALRLGCRFDPNWKVGLILRPVKSRKGEL